MKKKNFLLFFYFPLAGILVIFFVFSSINRRYIKNNVEDSVKEQLFATAEILKANISYFLKENFTPDEIFELYSDEKNIYFMALIDDQKRILGWSSRFEGYLPLSSHNYEDKNSWVIDSPVGKIFNIVIPLKTENEQPFFLYLGYSLGSLEEMMAHSRRSFFVIFGVLFVMGVFFFLGLYRLQNNYLMKEKEAENEKKEKERFQEISAFTSGVAHEIKNPLNSLSLLCELLQKRAPAELQENVSLGKKEIHKISRIIDQFSASQKPLKLKKEKFFLEDLLQDIQASLKNEIDKKNNEILYFQTRQIFLYADKQLISQAFINLLKNSLEAEPVDDIIIRARQKKNSVFLTFKDSGNGIAEQDKKNIFFPFFSKKEKGMGIGLYLTKKIIEAHGGKIGFQSELGQGTTFSVQIPGGKHE
ncbi:MAG: HAMP domain-containing histidine kinase [Candidatus Aminicenantes bacterium]|nr:HAMP domain-containing histidine kinase [Candidatus Aminicenantes bacterium]